MSIKGRAMDLVDILIALRLLCRVECVPQLAPPLRQLLRQPRAAAVSGSEKVN